NSAIRFALIFILVSVICAPPALAGRPKARKPKAPRPFAGIASTEHYRPPTTAAGFRELVAKCSRDHVEYRLSLGRLARELEDSERRGSIPDELRALRGFNWFIGFAIVEDGDLGRDVLLLGMHDPSRSPMDVDCLATAIRVVAEGKDIPACSLEPDGEALDP